MSLAVHWHASPRRDEPPTVDAGTGEIRVPIAVYAVDTHQADVELVMSRTEGETLMRRLAHALSRRPEAVR